MKNNGLVPRRDDLFFPLQDTFDRFFDNFFQTNPMNRVKAVSNYPKMNVSEQDGRFTVMAAVPGMRSEDVNVEITADNMLSISGRMSEEYQSTEDSVHHVRELRQTSFERKMLLPDNVKGDPEAVMENGILKLTWETEKLENEPEVRKIQVKSSET